MSAENFDFPMHNFTPRAQQVLSLAKKEAKRFGHDYIGTEHLLLGLIKLGQGVGRHGPTGYESRPRVGSTGG